MQRSPPFDNKCTRARFPAIYNRLFYNTNYSCILIGLCLWSIIKDRCTTDNIITRFFPLCFKMAESFENLDNIYVAINFKQLFITCKSLRSKVLQTLLSVLLFPSMRVYNWNINAWKLTCFRTNHFECLYRLLGHEGRWKLGARCKEFDLFSSPIDKSLCYLIHEYCYSIT